MTTVADSERRSDDGCLGGWGGKGRGRGGANLAFFCGAIDDFYSLDSTSRRRPSKSEVTKLAAMRGARQALFSHFGHRSTSPPLIFAFTRSHSLACRPRPLAPEPCLGARLSFGRNIHLPAASDGGRTTHRPTLHSKSSTFLHFLRRLCRRAGRGASML